MATTFLDVGLLKSVAVIFPFILTWVLVFALLEYQKFLGERKGLHSIIAFILAIFVAINPAVTALIMTMAPWFLMIFMLFFFCILLFKLFGLHDDALKALVQGAGGNEQLIWWIIIITAIIFLASLGSVFFSNPISSGEEVATTSGDVDAVGPGAFFQIIFHPKILGMIFVMMIGTFTIVLLSGKK